MSSLSVKSRVFNAYIRGEFRQHELQLLRNVCDWYIGQEECNESGLEHIQIMFGFKNPRHLSAIQRQFDWGANIQPTNDAQAMYKYVTDEEKRVEGSSLYVYGEVPCFRKKRDENEAIIKEALECETYEDAMRYIEERNLCYYINNYQRIGFYLSSKFDICDKPLYDISQFNLKPVDLTDNKVHVFIGRTGLGKTQFALAHFKKPLHVRDKEDYRRFSDRIDGIVMDDLAFKRWDPMTFLKLLDMENPVTQTVKYGSVRIRAGCPRIICVNDNDLLWPEGMHPETKKACQRRMVIHYFELPIYGAKRCVEVEIPNDVRHDGDVAENIRAAVLDVRGNVWDAEYHADLATDGYVQRCEEQVDREVEVYLANSDPNPLVTYHDGRDSGLERITPRDYGDAVMHMGVAAVDRMLDEMGQLDQDVDNDMFID